jgi:hypothetical protein
MGDSCLSLPTLPGQFSGKIGATDEEGRYEPKAVYDVEDYWDAAGGGSRLGPGDEGGLGLLQPKSVIRAKLLSLAQGLRGA